MAPLWHKSGMNRGRILSFFLLLNIAEKGRETEYSEHQHDHKELNEITLSN